MGQIGDVAGRYAADYQYRAEQAQKSGRSEKAGNYGRTIGEPVLSEKAQKYYENLKAKYGNMDFILVSPEMKEEAERNKGMYRSSKEFLVLIDSEKIEKMAEDESYRRKYEGILSGATSKMQMMKSQLGSNAGAVKSFGITFDDGGNASFFAVIDKSLAAQRERISEKKAEAAKERKAEAKKEAEEARKSRRGEQRADKWREDLTTVTSSSWQDLLRQIEENLASEQFGRNRSMEEQLLGQSVDYSV